MVVWITDHSTIGHVWYSDPQCIQIMIWIPDTSVLILRRIYECFAAADANKKQFWEWLAWSVVPAVESKNFFDATRRDFTERNVGYERRRLAWKYLLHMVEQFSSCWEEKKIIFFRLWVQPEQVAKLLNWSGKILANLSDIYRQSPIFSLVTNTKLS